MAVNLTPGAISKLSSGKFSSKDLELVVQVIHIGSDLIRCIDNKQWYAVALSDGFHWRCCYIADEIFISNKLHKGSILKLTTFHMPKPFINKKGAIYCISASGILGFDLTLIRRKCGRIGYPKLYPLNETPLFERSTPTIPDKDHTNSHHVEEPPTSKQKQGHVDSHLNESIDDSRHVEEPPTSKQKQDHVNLTPGAITKIMTGNIDLKPVLQLSYIKQDSRMMCSINGKQWYGVMLSDGSSKVVGLIADEMIRSKQLQKGSIAQLTKFQLVEVPNVMGEVRRCILVFDLTVIHSKSGIIGDPKLLPVERTAPTFPDEDQIHANSHHVEEPPTSIQNPLTSAQKCSSHSITQNNTDTTMGVNLTPGAITKIMTDKCSSTDLKPVVQVTNILSGRISSTNDKQCYRKIVLSDGSSSHFGCIADDIFISKKLQKGSIVKLTKFQFTKFSTYGNIRVLLINDLNVIHSNCDVIVTQEPFPRNDIPLVERSTPLIPDEDHVDVSHAQESATSKEKCSETQSRKRKHQSSNETPVLDRSKPTIMDHDHSESDTNEDVDNSHPAEEPSATTQKCSSHFPTKNNTDTIMGVNLTPGAITKIMTDKCTSNDPKPVVQVINIDSRLLRSEDDKKWYLVGLSDGSFKQYVAIAYEILISNKLQQGSIIQLTRYHKRVVARARYLVDVCDLHVIRSKCDTIGDPRLLPYNKAPLMENFVPPISDHKRADSDLNEDVDDSHCGEEPPDLKQNPSASTQNSSSHSLTQSKKRKCQSSNDDVSAVLKDISKIARTMMEKNKEDGVDACFKKLEELKEDVSKLTRMMMEKNKEDEVGSCFKKLVTLEEDVSKLTRMMMEKNKEDVMGFKKLETLEQDFFNMTRMAMEKNKEDVGSCKRLETLEEDVSKLTRMMMEKNKEDVMGFKKLETLEKDVSKMTELMMDKSKEVDAGFKKLETLEENVSKMTTLMMEKNKEDDVGSCFKKLEALGEDVSEMSRMMMKICKEDDMGACIRKLEKIGWGAQDPMYDTALLLFAQSADYRNLWLHLKPESCGNWVKNAGSMFGLLD